MNQLQTLTKVSISVALIISSSSILAAGFQLHEYSAVGLGRAFSAEGVAADNIGVFSRNPAALSLFDQMAISVGATFIDAKIDIEGLSPLGNNLDYKNAAPTQWVPNLHFIYPIDQQWSLGASIFSNYGLETRYDPDYPAGLLAGKTDLKTVNLNFSSAYRFNQHFSLGLGLNAVYADAEIIRYAGELGATGELGAMIASNTVASHLKGNQWGYGWNTGILYELDQNTRFALSYRSEISIDFNGDYSGLNTAEQTIPAKLKLYLPDIWDFSAYQQVNDQWAFHFAFSYTTWSHFKELKATNDSGSVLFQKDENFRDSARAALGVTYFYDPQWTFRTGIAFDKSPIPAPYRSLSIPDQDRFWYAAGTTYSFDDTMSVDLGIAYMNGRKVNINEPFGTLIYQTTAKGTAWLYAINFNYKF